MNESKGLLESIRKERERLAQNNQVPVDDLRILVFTSFSCNMISEGRACQLLCTNRIDFRLEWLQWLESHPHMEKISDSLDIY
ncbi:hypothetical protein [Anabaena lutea]|uniref:Uncharacterized protein n=1 Tax=Anabaena lutea FACHB-196 TaxID=2692881 RepID=A0ABR8FJ56_9NOST|nr:hypothetical protein [Anabaena lutea]MBD2570018.1 hypothetical protein [Anabaena lutea FACHB-196]